MKKKIILLMALIIMMVTATACDDKGSNTQSAVTPYATVTEDGRETGGYIDGRLGDKLQTAFFSFTVDNATLQNEYAGQTAPEGKSYLVAEISVKNTFGDVLPLWYDDFQVQWGKTDQEYGYPIEPTTDNQMPLEYELKKGETITKEHVYEVPTPDEMHEYSLSFLEYYDDGLEGNVFFVYFDLEP